MSKLAKKIFVTAIMAAVVATVAIPPTTAQAATVDELQEQIDALLATIAGLQADIAALGGGTPTGGGITGIPAGFTFTANMGQGSSGTSVMYLQILLNSNSATQVASTGVGSPGSETQFYGPLTTAAVTAFHNLYAAEILTPLGLTSGTGFFGASSRAKANSLLAVVPPDDGDGDGDGDDGTGDDGTPGIGTPGAEGSITVKYASAPIDGQDVFANSTDEGIVALEIKATGSDVMVNRIDILFNGTNPRPWLHIAKIHVLDGSTVVQTMDVTSSNTIETTVGSSYTIRMSGLNMLVPQDTTKTFTIQIDAILQPGETSITVGYRIGANGVRGTDGAGLTQTEPGTALAARTFVTKSSDVAEIELSTDPDNPDKERNIIVSKTVTTKDVVLLVLSIKSKTNASIIRSINASATAPANTILKLYDGSTLLKTVTADGVNTGAGDNFTELDISIAKDTTKVLTIKADIPKQSTVDGTASTTISVQANSSTPIVAEDATTFASVNVTGSTVTGGKTRMFEKAPTLAISTVSLVRVDAPATGSNTIRADFSIKVDVTALGGDIYVASNTSNGLRASSSVPASSTIAATSLTSNATEQTTTKNWLVRSGETKWFTISGKVTNTDTSSYSVRVLVDEFKWGTTDAAPTTNTQTWGLDDLKTGTEILDSTN